MTDADLTGYATAACVFLTFYMKTMLPLRVAGIASNVLFIAYGYAELAYPVLILHLVLLPLNLARLRQIRTFIRNVEEATRNDLSMDWVKPFSSTRTASAGLVSRRLFENMSLDEARQKATLDCQPHFASICAGERVINDDHPAGEWSGERAFIPARRFALNQSAMR